MWTPEKLATTFWGPMKIKIKNKVLMKRHSRTGRGVLSGAPAESLKTIRTKDQKVPEDAVGTMKNQRTLAQESCIVSEDTVSVKGTKRKVRGI